MLAFRHSPPRHCKRQRSFYRRLGLEVLEGRRLLSAYYVSPSGSDGNPGTLSSPFKTIGHALAVARQPNDQVNLRTGTYHERLVLPHGGSARAGWFVLQAYPGDHPVLDGAGLPGTSGDYMVYLHNLSYVKIVGMEIVNNTVPANPDADGAGIRVEGFGSNIVLEGNTIHQMEGHDDMGITVYGTSKRPISGLVIDGNAIYDCQAAQSEALTLNGNVAGFRITNNTVHDVNNIGIDMIGGDRSINPNPRLVARNGLVSKNVVYHARSSYGGGFAAGIYVDGGRNITIDSNVSYENDIGLSVGAENRGAVARRVIVENNLIYDNDTAGLDFGGYAAQVGRVRNCSFINNTVYKNDTLNSGYGQLWIEYASRNIVTNNIFWASANGVLLGTDYEAKANVHNHLDNNLWYADAGPDSAVFWWNRQEYHGFAAYRAHTREDAHSLFADPDFVDAAAADFHLAAQSPAIDAGSSVRGRFAPHDFDGRVRPLGPRPDMGAFEFA